jgi:predicted lipoprotein with Yx(FWY)xxD motif
MATENGSTRTGLAALLAKGTIATIALGAGAVAVSTLAFPPPASAKGVALVLKTEHVGKVGTVLATGTGLTLYRYTVDPAGKATCTGACAKVWPPLLLPKGVTHVKAPHGVKGLTAIRVHGGRLQVFFHNHALYSFASDTKKGEATGQGVENDWFAVLSNGKSSVSNAVTTPTSTGGTGAGSNTGSNTGTSTNTGSNTGTTAPPATTPSPTGSSTSTPPTAPPVTKSPPATAPPTTAPPVTTPPPTTTPPTSPPPTTTAPPTGGVGF